MKIESLKPGMVVYDVHSHRAGNTTARTYGVWEVVIKEVDLEKGRVLVSWNTNPPHWIYRRKFSWRLKKPVMVKTWIGQRPATREEIKAMEARP